MKCSQKESEKRLAIWSGSHVDKLWEQMLDAGAYSGSGEGAHSRWRRLAKITRFDVPGQNNAFLNPFRISHFLLPKISKKKGKKEVRK